MTDKCKCSMAISVLGDGCRYCQPQEYIDRLHESIDEDRKEIEQKDKDFSRTVREMLVLSVDAEKDCKELKELKDHINKVWLDTYPNAEDATTMLAIKNRVLNLAQDRDCWLFNARVANNKLNELERK